MKEINELTGEEAAAELAHIAREMAKADIAYYQNDNPYLTDAESSESSPAHSLPSIMAAYNLW